MLKVSLQNTYMYAIRKYCYHSNKETSTQGEMHCALGWMLATRFVLALPPHHPINYPPLLPNPHYHSTLSPPTYCTPHSILTLLPHPPTHPPTNPSLCTHTTTTPTHPPTVPLTLYSPPSSQIRYTLSLTTHHTPYPPHSPTSHVPPSPTCTTSPKGKGVKITKT